MERTRGGFGKGNGDQALVELELSFRSSALHALSYTAPLLNGARCCRHRLETNRPIRACTDTLDSFESDIDRGRSVSSEGHDGQCML